MMSRRDDFDVCQLRIVPRPRVENGRQKPSTIRHQSFKGILISKKMEHL
jgi:hypothetical protein